MFQLKNNEFDKLSNLCMQKNDNLFLLWFLDGNPSCYAWVDQLEEPSEALILIADFCYILGDIKNPNEMKTLLDVNAKNKLIIPYDELWTQYLKNYFLNNLHVITRYDLKPNPNGFDCNKLDAFIKCIHSNYTLSLINENIYNEVLTIDWAADGCCYFKSYEDFKLRGIGYVIYEDTQLLCIASSYISYDNTIDITIGTAEKYQKKGLATACASKLILECLKKRITPSWSASNLASLNLAEKLGYHLDKEYDVFIIK